MAEPLPEGMFRPQRAPDFEQKQAQLRNTAARLFVERGVQNTALDDVGRIVGCSERTVRRYFLHKHGLLVEIVTLHMLALVEAVGGAAQAPLRTRLAAIAAAYLGAARAGRDAHRILRHQLHELPDAARADMRVRQRWLRLPIEDTLAMLRPAAPETARKAACLSFLATLDAAAEWLREGALAEADIARAAAAMALAALRALGAAAPA